MINGMRDAKCPAMAWAGGFSVFHERASPTIRAGKTSLPFAGATESIPIRAGSRMYSQRGKPKYLSCRSRSSHIGHSPSVIPHRSFPISHSPSVIPHRSLPITPSPSLIPHHSSPIGHSPSLLPRQSFPVSHSPSVIPHTPSVISHQPSPLGHPPSIVSRSPLIINFALQKRQL